MIGLPIFLAFVATRIRRLDRFLHQYLALAAIGVSVLLGLSLWIRRGEPTALWPLIALLATIIETLLFLFFCGGAVQIGLSQITGKEEEEYKEQREAEAQEIAAEAIAGGDPGIAAGIFGLNVAGAWSAAMASGCLQFLLFLFHMVAVWVVSALDAHFLFQLSLRWSLAAATIIAAAATRVVTLSEEFGERYSGSIPLHEKFKGILPRRED